ncbi:hypothetical protein P43SY_006708 [Pythium insidiosum]|uniref:Uncharacterized protein n=1 Tax=Pythium insidiosum TaxID=114742 RepID=A0AAD5QCP4_PYTIN|nr:hypothetical protein P43SY_006708 [Pythium insidiosum]
MEPQQQHGPWDGTDIPSQQGKTVVVTGANAGIGFVVAQRLAERGARVILACRDETRGNAAAAAIDQRLAELKDDNDAIATGSVEVMQMDVGALASVKAFAQRLRDTVDRVDLLINNAGVGAPTETKSADGLSIQFGVNHLGHFHLTNLVFDLLKASPAARVVNVSSVAHRMDNSKLLGRSTEIDFDQLATGEGDPGWARYEKSKLCNLLFTYELQRRVAAAKLEQIRSVAAHPGVCHTNIFDETARAYFPRFLLGLLHWIFGRTMQTADMGALPILYAATVESVQSGEYYGPDGAKSWYGYPQLEQSSEASHSEEYGRRLWALSEQLTETSFLVA